MSNDWLVEAQDALGEWLEMGRYKDNASAAAAIAERYPTAHVRVLFDPEKVAAKPLVSPTESMTPLEKASASYEASRLREALFAREQERKAERARLAKRFMLTLVAKNVDDVHTGQLRMIVSEATLAQYAVSCADALLSALDAPRKP